MQYTIESLEKLDQLLADPQFTLDNKELRTWLETTPLHDVAAWTANIVRRVELDKIANYYDAAQDFYADSWYEWSDYESGKLAAKDFVNVVELAQTKSSERKLPNLNNNPLQI